LLRPQVFRHTLFTVVILRSLSTQSDSHMWWRDISSVKWPRLNYPQISLGFCLLSFLTTLFQQGLLCTVSGHVMCNQRYANSQTGWIMLIYYPNNGLGGGSNTTTALSQNFLSLS
jgi:hypothetical protein